MITRQPFGTIAGKEVFLFTFKNKKNDTLSITNYGGIITSWTARNKKGKQENITIGFNSLEKYLPNKHNFGALIGRYANRIAGARFKLNDITYHLGKSEGRHQLHGGIHNYSKAVWHAIIDADREQLILLHASRDGDEGFPGNLIVRVIFHLNDENELSIQYHATSDQDTHINLTSHPYFNLGGDFSKPVVYHELTIYGHAYTPVNKEGIPTGIIAPTKGTAYDFTERKKILKHIAEVSGYDRNFVLDSCCCAFGHAATLHDPKSGRTLDVYTDQPGLQLYTANHLDGSILTDDGVPLNRYAALCLETQHFPDTPNQPHFPPTLLKKGIAFKSITKYRLSCK
jgi:aldose 1-epimerase